MATGGALGSLPAETFLFQALLKLQDEFHVPVEEIQNSIQSSYSMLAEFNKVNATTPTTTTVSSTRFSALELTYALVVVRRCGVRGTCARAAETCTPKPSRSPLVRLRTKPGSCRT